MSEIADRYRRLSTAFAEKIAAVPPDRWGSPSPCEDWTALDVVRHVVQTQDMFEGFVGRSIGPVPPVDDDPAAAWDATRVVVQADLDDPERAQATYEGQFGSAVWERSVDGFLCFDLVVHGWDLARAAGLDDTIDPGEVARVMTHAESMGDNLRTSGACGPAVDPPPDADPQTRMLAFLGRKA